jgi:hypothetical protein
MKMVSYIEVVLKALSLLAVFVFLSGMVVNLGYFEHLEGASVFVTTSDTFANFAGLRDALLKGVAIVFVAPVVATITMIAIYHVQPPSRTRRFVGGGIAIIGFCMVFSLRWLREEFVSSGVNASVFLAGFMIFVFGIVIIFIPEVSRWEWPGYSVLIILILWLLACYGAGFAWSVVDRDFRRKDFIYMRTEAGQCLKRRLVRSLDAGFFVVGNGYSEWELWPKGKIIHLSNKPCEPTSSNPAP